MVPFPLGRAIGGGMLECLVTEIRGLATAISALIRLIRVGAIPERLKSPIRLLLGHDVHRNKDEIIAGLKGSVISPVGRRIQQGAVAKRKLVQIGLVHLPMIKVIDRNYAESRRRNLRRVVIGDRTDQFFTRGIVNVIKILHRRRCLWIDQIGNGDGVRQNFCIS